MAGWSIPKDRSGLHALRCNAALLAAVALSSCAAPAGSAALVQTMAPTQAQIAAPSTPIRHVVIVVQENRTFDNFFSGFPGADGARTGRTANGRIVRLKRTSLALAKDVPHWHADYVQDYDGGKMDGFAHGGIGLYPYAYTDPNQIQPYWTLARRYVLADRMFQTQGSGSFTAHQDLIAGGTQVDPNRALVDYPLGEPWGCDAQAGAVTSLLGRDGQFFKDKGPFPCLTYATLRDLLDAKGVPWKYYVPPYAPVGKAAIGSIWNAYEAIRAVRYSKEWGVNVVSPETLVLEDAREGKLPAVSWVIPNPFNSDHPGVGSSTGPSWVAQIVNAVGRSRAWRSTAIVVVWDDWGGLYDHVAPAQLGYGGVGFRVPMLIVSPYARAGYVSHTQYEFGSILKFVEDNWNLGRLGTSDVRANSLSDTFDFNAPPRAFVPVDAPYSRAFFERQPPSDLPVDDE